MGLETTLLNEHFSVVHVVVGVVRVPVFSNILPPTLWNVRNFPSLLGRILHTIQMGNFVGREGDFIFGDKGDGVGDGNAGPDSFCEVAKLIGNGILLDSFGWSLDKLV